MRLSRPVRPMLLSALILSIPAFYLVLTEAQHSYRHAGHWLYGVVAAILVVEILARHDRGKPGWHGDLFKVDIYILLGALASAWPTGSPWPPVEWLLRLVFCAVVFLRLGTLLARYVVPHRLLQIVTLAVFVLAVAGAGFFWLEPKVHSYADGIWLAFITGATVGYGDLVPSTPASRIFAAFVVLLGYVLFSVVTASVAALFVSEDEKRIRREMHADMRMLRVEIAELRAELRDSFSASDKDGGQSKDT